MSPEPTQPEPEPISAAGDVLDTNEAGGLVIRGGALRVMGYVVGALLSLGSAPLLIRQLGVDDFGRYFTVVSLIGLVAGVTDVGLATVMLREFSVRTGPARDEMMRGVLGARLVLATCGVILAALFALAAGYGSELVVGTLVAGGGLIIGVAQATFAVPLSAALRNGAVTVIDLGRTAIAVLGTVLLVLAGAHIVAFLAVPVFAGLVLLVVTVLLVRGSVPMRPSLRSGELGPLLRETLPLAIATILNVLYGRLVIIAMSLIATAQATGYFSTSYRIIEVLVGMPVALIATTFPLLSRAARDDHERLRFALQRTLEVALLGGLLLTLGTALAAGTAIDLLGGDAARPAAGTLTLLALALTPVFINVACQHTLLALRRHRELVVANGLALVVIACATFALVPPLGAEGAALAVVIGETALMTISGIALFRAHPDLRPSLRVVPRAFAASAVGVLLALAVQGPDVVRAAIALTAYTLVVVALRALPPELRTALSARLRPRTA